MDKQEEAAWAVWNFLEAEGVETPQISDTGTVDNLLESGYTLDTIIAGGADEAILDHVCWLSY